MDQPPILYDPDKVDQLDIPPFLGEVIEYTRERVAARMADVPVTGLSALTTIRRRPVPVADVLRGSDISLIATVKHQKLDGIQLIKGDNYHPVELARAFVNAGASAVAVTTNPKYYAGDLHDLALISGEVDVPTIRQDFIFDEYQVIETRAAGADGLVLFTSMLGQQRLRNLLSLTQRLRMTAIVVIHNAEELERVLELDPRIIGINNRNWHDFTVDLERTVELSQQIPRHIVTVSLGGIDMPEKLQYIAQNRVNAVSMGAGLLGEDNSFDTVQHLYSLIDSDPTDPWEAL